MTPDGSPASGIYALARLDGAPVEPADADALGIATSAAGSCLASAVDTLDAGAIHEARDKGGITIVAGYIEEADRLRSRLGLARETPLALVARSALERFGSAMPEAVIGEWSLLHWEPAGRMTLMASAARRDRLFYAIAGPRVAVAPDLFRLSALGWIGTAVDETGLLFGLARGGLRGRVGDRTMLSRVRQLEPGSSVVLTAQRARKSSARAFQPQQRWPGSFEDGMAEAESVIRTILRERLARTQSAALMLSGGLDSSTLACFAAQERPDRQPLMAFTSVAPPGSGLPDEADFAGSVAAQLGLESELVWPPEEANIYRPADFILAGASGPPLPTRHCLTQAFQARARSRNATMLVDGTWGEFTLTAYAPEPSLRRRLRAAAGSVRRLVVPHSAAAQAAESFHVRLSPHRLAALPEALRSNPDAAPEQLAGGASNRLWGFHPGVVKAMRHPNEFYGGAVRVEFPCRDTRLLRLFASFPASFMSHGGIKRAPARHITAGHLPDKIRLRTSGGAASPDHLQRMQRQAGQARARIAAFRAADVDEWLDLDWLGSALARVASKGPRDYGDANHVQLTAIAAEFLTWWRGRS